MNSLKRISLTVLIISLVILTFLAVLSIWGMLSSDIAWKAISTLGVIAFSSLVALTVARSLENKNTDSINQPKI